MRNFQPKIGVVYLQRRHLLSCIRVSKLALFSAVREGGDLDVEQKFNA